MKFNLRTELKKLHLGKEDLREDLWSPVAKENDSISASDIGMSIPPSNEIEDAEDDVSTIENLIVATEALIASESKPTHLENVALRLTVLQLRNSDRNENLYLGTESNKDGFLALALEDLKSKFKNAKDKVVETVKAIWERVVAFLRGLFDKDKKLIKRAQDLLKTVTKTQITTGVTVPYNKLICNFTMDKKTSGDIINGILSKVSKLYDAHTKVLATLIQTSQSMDDETFKEKVTKVINAMGDLIIKDMGLKDNDAIEKINDTWACGIIQKNDFIIPSIKILTSTKVETIPTISSKEAKTVIENVIKVLGINADEDLRAANVILHKMKSDEVLGEELSSVIGLVGQFVLHRTNIRYSISRDILMYVELCLKDTSDESGTNQSWDREAEDREFGILRKNFKDKDETSVKSTLINLLRNDLVRSTSLKNYASISSKNFPSLFDVNEEDLNIKTSYKDWTPDYFSSQIQALENNFSMERFDHLLKVKNHLSTK